VGSRLVDVGDLLAYQALTWRMVAGVFGCRVELVEPRSGATVRGDRVRLTQAVGNIVATRSSTATGACDCGRAPSITSRPAAHRALRRRPRGAGAAGRDRDEGGRRG
jgi:hypothetical protein